MAGNGSYSLLVSAYPEGYDKTTRRMILEGQLVPNIQSGSLATLTLVAGGTGWAVNDEFTIPSIPGAVGKVLTEAAGVAETLSIIVPGSGGTAGTGVATAAISPSTGAGLTVTTTVNAGGFIPITGWSITSNALTLNAVNSLTGGGGQSIIVAGFSGSAAFLNGEYTTTSATSTTIVVPLTAANGSGTQQGLATLTPTYTTGGIPVNVGFINESGNLKVVPGISGGNYPNGFPGPAWIDVKTLSASGYNYQVNLTTNPPLVKALNGVTEVSNGSSLPSDTVGFRAEYLTAY